MFGSDFGCWNFTPGAARPGLRHLGGGALGLGSVPQSCESASHGCPSRRLRVEASVSWRLLFCMFLSTCARRSRRPGVQNGRFINRQSRQWAGGIGGERLSGGSVQRPCIQCQDIVELLLVQFRVHLQTREGLASCRQNADLEFHVSQKTCEGLASCRQNAAGVSRLSENV